MEIFHSLIRFKTSIGTWNFGLGTWGALMQGAPAWLGRQPFKFLQLEHLRNALAAGAAALKERACLMRINVKCERWPKWAAHEFRGGQRKGPRELLLKSSSNLVSHAR